MHQNIHVKFTLVIFCNVQLNFNYSRNLNKRRWSVDTIRLVYLTFGILKIQGKSCVTIKALLRLTQPILWTIPSQSTERAWLLKASRRAYWHPRRNLLSLYRDCRRPKVRAVRSPLSICLGRKYYIFVTNRRSLVCREIIRQFHVSHISKFTVSQFSRSSPRTEISRLT